MVAHSGTIETIIVLKIMAKGTNSLKNNIANQHARITNSRPLMPIFLLESNHKLKMDLHKMVCKITSCKTEKNS